MFEVTLAIKYCPLGYSIPYIIDVVYHYCRGGLGGHERGAGENGTTTGKACPKGLYGTFCEVNDFFSYVVFLTFILIFLREYLNFYSRLFLSKFYVPSWCLRMKFFLRFRLLYD